MLQSVADVRQESDLTGSLDGNGDLTLMLCAAAGDAAGQDLASLADELSQAGNILIVKLFDLVGAEQTNFLSLAVHTGLVRSLCGGCFSGLFVIHFYLFLSCGTFVRKLKREIVVCADDLEV